MPRRVKITLDVDAVELFNRLRVAKDQNVALRCIGEAIVSLGMSDQASMSDAIILASYGISADSEKLA